jgi:hypothetical protein
MLMNVCVFYSFWIADGLIKDYHVKKNRRETYALYVEFPAKKHDCVTTVFQIKFITQFQLLN